jgi:antitoxin FitA
MSTLTFQLEEAKADKLARAANDLGVQVEELLQRITDEYLARQQNFEVAAAYVLQKNAELYRRLAK